MKIQCINGNGIKLLAAVLMVIDHIGMFFFSQATWLRCIGRISLPLFAYMLAEGCRHTKNKLNHLLLLASVAIVCQIVSFVVAGSLNMCILVTFTLSTLIIYSLQHFGQCLKEHEKNFSAVLAGVGFASMVFLTLALNSIAEINGVPFSVEYGFWGCMLPVFPAAADCIAGEIALPPAYAHAFRLSLFTAGLVILCAFHVNYLQWFSLIALIPLALYNGQKGKLKLKYFFYVFYPAHLAIFYIIAYFL